MSQSKNLIDKSKNNFSTHSKLQQQVLEQKSKVMVYNKNLENVNFQLNLADKTKRQLQESYGKQVDKVEKKIFQNEHVLSQVLQEINEKESHIFEVQRVKVEGFKNEVSKFEKIKELTEDHMNFLKNEINTNKKKERSLVDQCQMLYEDFLSNSNEEILIKEKLIELKDTLKQIEKTYPKDFEFLSEDIMLEKELREVEELKKQITKEIKDLENFKKKLQHDKLDKEERKELVEVEFRKIDEQIEESYVDGHLKIMEDYLVNNVSDLLVFNNLRNILQGNYHIIF